uniref:Uncharacterized protein n=1 Tax=Setaria italica TaxID=4555 RepID=K3Y1L5_SETIT
MNKSTSCLLTSRKYSAIPNLLKKKGAIEELEKDLQKEVNSVNQRLNIAIEK